MTAIPPGFRVVDTKPRVQFDFAPGTPQSVIDATKAYAESDAQPQGVEIPDGFSLLGPGVGKPSPNAGAQDQQRTEEIRQGEPASPLSNFVTGNAYGIQGTGIGALQTAAHMLPPMPMEDWTNTPVPEQQSSATVMDGVASRFDARRSQDPAMHTGAGKMGEFSGGMMATAPLAELAVPAKGASMLSWLARGGYSGAAIAATQPVPGGEHFGGAKLKQVAAGAAFGAVIPASLRGGMSLAERAFAPNAMAQVANFANKGANAKPFAREGEALAERTGIRLTPGQVSGSKVQTALENMSRQSIFSADRAFEADTRVAHDAIRYMDKVMDNVTRNPASEASIGTQIQAASRGAVEKIASKREQVAAADYGAIDKALGNKKFVQSEHAMAEADKIINEYGPVASPEAKRIVAQAEALKAQLRNNGGMTFTEAQRTRGYYGRGARGGANVFDDVNPDINRRIATRLFRAFDSDLEASATRLGSNNLGPGIVPGNYFKGQLGNGDQGLTQAIRNANANYRRYSQLIEATKSHPIARLFGDHINIDDVVQFDKIPPETVISRLGQMKPTELHMVRDYMEQQAPEAWQQYKRLVLEKAVDSARVMPASMGANTVPFNALQFVRALGGDKPDKVKQLQAVFGSSELHEIDDALNVARRLGDRFGYNGSGTGPYNEAAKFFDAMKSFSAKAIASSGGEVMGLRKVASVMLNSDGRRALIQLSRLPPGSRQAASLLGFVASLAAGQSSQRSNNPQRGQGP